VKRLSVPLWLEISAGVLIVLVLSNALTLYVAEKQRLTSARTERFQVVETRLAAFMNLYRRLPGEAQAQLVNLASARYEKLAVSSVPRVAADIVRDARMEERLRDALGLMAGADVRVARRGRPSLSLVSELHPKRQERIAVAVSIAPGQWLNGEFYWPVGESLVPGIMFAAGVSGVLLVLLSMWIARRLSSPLRELALAAERLQHGHAVSPLRAQGSSTLQATVSAFNQMAQRLVPLVDSQRTVLASVGHDLRTPITSLRLKSEFIDDENLRHSFAGSLDELQHLTEAALQVARDGVSDEPARRMDIAAIVESVCADLSDLRLDVTCTLPGPIEGTCRPHEFRRAVRNLVENAVKYGGSAAVLVSADRERVRVDVLDRGPGLGADDLERVFSPFVRGDKTGRPGHGLGLTLSRAIARAHGGDVCLANREGGGLAATITIAHQP
jgi:signal transduction histidine kinase